MPFWLIAYGQTKLDSSVVAIILGIIPVFTAFFKILLVKEQSWQKQYIGMTVAFAGLLILINPGAEDFKGSLNAYLAIIGAALCFAVAFMLMDRIPTSVTAMQASRFILMIYSIPFFIFWLYTGRFDLPNDSNAWYFLQ